MYSLRTDDIPGARPRLRHYEKKLIRQPEKVAPEGYVPSFPSLQEIKLQIEAKSAQTKYQNQPGYSSEVGQSSRQGKLTLPQQEYTNLDNVQLSESQIVQLEQPLPRYRKPSLQLPKDEPKNANNPQEEQHQRQQIKQPMVLPKQQSPTEPKEMLSSHRTSSRPRPLIQGTTFNIITNHRMQYKIEPLGYVPSWN